MSFLPKMEEWSEEEERCTYYCRFVAIAKVNGQYYRLARADRGVRWDEFLTACMDVRNILHANRRALESERNSARLRRTADGMIEDVRYSFHAYIRAVEESDNGRGFLRAYRRALESDRNSARLGVRTDGMIEDVINDLSFTKTCLEFGAGIEYDYWKFESGIDVVFDITDPAETRYGVFDRGSIYCIERSCWADVAEKYEESLPVEFHSWCTIGIEASHFAREVLGVSAPSFKTAYQDLIGETTPSPNHDSFPISITNCDKIYNARHWLRIRSSGTPNALLLELLLLALEEMPTIEHLDLARFNLDAGETKWLFSKLPQGIIIRSLDLSGIDISTEDLTQILTPSWDIKTLFLFDTPQVPLRTKLSLCEDLEIHDLYDTDLYKYPAPLHNSTFVEFIWWRDDKTPLIIPIPYAFGEERIRIAILYFLENISSNHAPAEIFRRGLAYSDSKVYPMPGRDQRSTVSPLEEGRATVVLLSTDRGSSLVLVSLGGSKTFSRVMYASANRILAGQKVIELEPEDIFCALRDLDLLPCARVPGSFPDDVDPWLECWPLEEYCMGSREGYFLGGP